MKRRAAWALCGAAVVALVSLGWGLSFRHIYWETSTFAALAWAAMLACLAAAGAAWTSPGTATLRVLTAILLAGMLICWLYAGFGVGQLAVGEAWCHIYSWLLT
jgi:hypothetical protein